MNVSMLIIVQLQMKNHTLLAFDMIINLIFSIVLHLSLFSSCDRRAIMFVSVCLHLLKTNLQCLHVTTLNVVHK